MNLEFWQIAALFIGGLFCGYIIGHRLGAVFAATRAAADITMLLHTIEKRFINNGLDGRNEIEGAIVEIYGQDFTDFMEAQRKAS